MKRRNFIKNVSVATLAATTLGVASCGPSETEKKIEDKKAPDTSNDFELDEASIQSLQDEMTKGTRTSRSITELYLKRIEAIDKNGPKLNSVIEINPDALSIAESMDRERKEGKIRGLLHGIPILIKDNIDTSDNMMTTAGSLALEGNKSIEDAFVVKQLRKAGAVLLGKTNLSEWANFRSTRSTSGWSSRGGQTRNPYALDRNPSGSSSGSGASVSANLCAAAIGTETNGSVISPASHNGIVGIKPTVGLVSRRGIIPISSTQDTAGPMTRTVTDAAIVLGAIAGIDEGDRVTLESAGKSPKDYLQYLNADGLSGKRIGIEKASLEGHEGCVALMKEAIELMKAKGATLVDVEMLKPVRESFGSGEFAVLQYEFKDGLNKYLAQGKRNVKSLTEVIAFNKQNETKAMPYFKQETLESSDAKDGLDSKEYKEALAKVLATRKFIDDLMKQNNLDAISGISLGPARPIDLVNGDSGTGYYFCPPAAMAGYPHITVPMGFVQMLPIGLSFMAGAYKEADIISLAYAYEQASNKRAKPKFLSSSIPV